MAPEGTERVIWVELLRVKVAVTPPTLTLVVPSKPVPVIVTLEPTAPLAGVKEVTTGATVAAGSLLPPHPSAPTRHTHATTDQLFRTTIADSLAKR